MRLCVSILMLLVLCGCSQAPPTRTAPCAATKASGILMMEWRVGAITHGGTAFVLRHAGKDYVVTAAHTVSDPEGKLHLMDAGGTPVPFIVQSVHRREGVDAVIFEVTSLPESVRRFRASTAAPGAPVEAYGYPASLEARTCVRAAGNARTRLLSASCRIQSGMSGGPVLSKDGKAVGVVSSRVLGDEGETSSHVDMLDVLSLIGE